MNNIIYIIFCISVFIIIMIGLIFIYKNNIKNNKESFHITPKLSSVSENKIYNIEFPNNNFPHTCNYDNNETNNKLVSEEFNFSNKYNIKLKYSYFLLDQGYGNTTPITMKLLNKTQDIEIVEKKYLAREQGVGKSDMKDLSGKMVKDEYIFKSTDYSANDKLQIEFNIENCRALGHSLKLSDVEILLEYISIEEYNIEFPNNNFPHTCNNDNNETNNKLVSEEIYIFKDYIFNIYDIKLEYSYSYSYSYNLTELEVDPPSITMTLLNITQGRKPIITLFSNKGDKGDNGEYNLNDEVVSKNINDKTQVRDEYIFKSTDYSENDKLQIEFNIENCEVEGSSIMLDDLVFKLKYKNKFKNDLTDEQKIAICKNCENGTQYVDNGGCKKWCSIDNKCGNEESYKINGIDCSKYSEQLYKDYKKSNNIDINIKNDIIAEDNIKIHGITIDIDKLRQLKNKNNFHYQNGICLSDTKGKVECLKKEHIDMIKGKLPLNIITYPDNYRKCLTAVNKNIVPEWSSAYKKYSTYTGMNCKDGDDDMQFYIQRNNLGLDNKKIHADYHGHSIDNNVSHNDITTQSIDNVTT